MNKVLKQGLHRDISGEKKAVRDYSQRIKESKDHPSASRTLRHIKGEEQEHKRELEGVLSGLKSAIK